MTTTDTTDPWRDENDTSIAASRSETRRPTVGDAPTPNLADALEFDATYWRDLHWIIELADRQDAAAAQLRQLDRIKAQLRQLDRIEAALDDERILRDLLVTALNDAWGDYTGDTHCYPEVLTVTRGPYVEADFGKGNFTLMAACWFQRRLRDALESPDV